MDRTAGGLAILTIRPPTPPHEVDTQKDIASPGNIIFSKHTVRSRLDTPEESPNSSADYFSRSSERPLKRVDFLSDNSNLLTQASRSIVALGKDVRAIPPSKDCKPPKSILKPFKYNIPSEFESKLPEHTTRSFPRMLEDVIRELSSSSRSSRLDAYQTLNGCLKTYDDTPDPDALVDKLPLLTDLIRRDLSLEASEKVVLDTQLVTQVLKLLGIFLWTPKLADMLQDDFRIFILSQSINVIGNPSSSKTVVNHYMHLAAVQKFPPKIMNNDRANRLLNVLGEITSNVKGNGVVGQRLMIYKTLLTQTNALMVSRVSDWIDHLFSGMLSNIKEVRSRALAFGLDASATLGTTSQVSRAVLEIFNRQSLEGKKFSDVLVHRLNDMLSSRDEGVHVPQIWSVVMLFLRSRRNQLEHWEYMRVWLVIIQKCFNSTDNQVKFQAHISWNRLIFAINPSVATGSSMVKMLRQPIVAQLDRKSSDKHSKQAKQIAYATYCTLIYYALRPGSSYDGLDRFWAEYIAPLLIKTDANFACEVLSFLLGDSQQTAWTENRAIDGLPMKPEELPRLDPQWVRMKSAAVLEVLEPLLLTTKWESSNTSQSWVLQAWRGFTKALGDAGSKEVKISTETLSAMADMLNCMKHVSMSKHDESCSDSPFGIQKLASLVSIAVDNLGPIPFAEKRIIRTSGYSFQAADTPSSRAPRAQGLLASAMVHLIGMVLSCFHDANKYYEDILRDFIRLALRSATSRHSKLKILREVAYLTTLNPVAENDANNCLWTAVLEVLVTLTPISRSDGTAAASTPQAGQDYREMIKILELEVQSSTPMKSSWAATFDHINVHVQRECGIGGSILAIIEPFAAVLRRDPGKSYDQKTIQQIIVLVRNAGWPESRKDLERAQRTLWGPNSGLIRSSTNGLFEGLFALLDDVLCTLYTSSSVEEFGDNNNLFQAISSFIGSCPPSASAVLLKRMQNGVAYWIKDTEGHMNNEDRSYQLLFSAVVQTWTTISQLISNLPKFDTNLLLLLAPLIDAGLSSRHKAVVNLTINLWNTTFGLTIDLEYPSVIAVTLRRLSRATEISAPCLFIDNDECFGHDSTPFDFIETPEALEQNLAPDNSRSQGLIRESPSESIEYRVETIEAGPEPPSNVANCTSTPSPRKGYTARSPIARLRHNDSQIQFAAIESSPSCSEAMESQFLTERQREVNKRQHQEAAAMFPDIRSSSRRKSRDCATKPPRLHLGLARDIRSHDRVDEIVSPTLPLPNDISNTFLDSTPTPSSSAKRSSRFFHQDGPPSSPPPFEDHGAVEKKLLSPSRYFQDIVDEILIDPTIDPQAIPRPGDEKSGSAYLSELESDTQHPRRATNFLHEHVLESPNAKIDDGPTSTGFQKSKDCSTNASEQDATEVRQQSPLPNRAQENKPTLQSGISTDTIAQISVLFSNAPENMIESKYHDISVDSDDEVSAQIANDMERALSQAAESSKASSPLDTRAQATGAKRKWLSMSPEPNTKRRCSPRLSGSAEIDNMKQAQAPTEEEILECIVVSSPVILSEADTGDESGRATHPPVTRGRYRVGKHVTLKKQSRPRKTVRDAATLHEPEELTTSSIEIESIPKMSEKRPSVEEESGRRSSGFDVPGSASCSPNQPGFVVSTQPVQLTSTDTTEKHYQPDQVTVTLASYSAVHVGAQPELAGYASRNDLIGRESEIEVAESMAVLGGSSPSSSQDAGTHLSLHSSQHMKPSAKVLLGESSHGADTSNEPAKTSVGLEGGQASAAGILEKLRMMLVEAREAVLQPAEGREVISAWMDLGRELQDAERRGAT
ncbi:hypothetical protein MMC26_001235 [Xylographa opegraphella]|nr:hypothetical protein [Xylographa opegraphella]